MREKLVAGNWKMNGSRHAILDFVAALAASGVLADAAERHCAVAIMPPVGYLDCMARELAGHPDTRGVILGAQDLHPESSGAFTGETSGPQLFDLGARMVLVGHSERRRLCGENDALVRRKFSAALDAGLIPVLCVGETLDEREAGEALAVCRRQLRAVLEGAGPQGLARGLVAYEPVWAIGTGRTASPEQAQEMHAGLRHAVAEAAGEAAAAELRMLYGGSVKADNAAALAAMPDIDGALVGGASLDAEAFTAIIAATATV